MAKYKIEATVTYKGQQPRTYTVGTYDNKKEANEAYKKCYTTVSRTFQIVKL